MELGPKIAKVHKFFGYFMILLAITTSSSGIALFEEKYNPEPRKYLAGVNMFIAVLVIVISEIILRIWRRKSKTELK